MNLTVSNSAPKTPRFGKLVYKNTKSLSVEAQKLVDGVLNTDSFKRITRGHRISLSSRKYANPLDPEGFVFDVLNLRLLPKKGKSNRPNEIKIGIIDYNLKKPKEFIKYCCDVLKYRLSLV